MTFFTTKQKDNGGIYSMTPVAVTITPFNTKKAAIDEVTTRFEDSITTVSEAIDDLDKGLADISSQLKNIETQKANLLADQTTLESDRIDLVKVLEQLKNGHANVAPVMEDKIKTTTVQSGGLLGETPYTAPL